MSLAARVADEQNTTVGKLVGYSVRFEETSGPETRIKYVTDGMLVRELLSDCQLSRYRIIIVDEAHERTLRTDMLIANLKTILHQRNKSTDKNGKTFSTSTSTPNPLKVVIMSATLDAEKFSQFYDKYVAAIFTEICC
jgi:ATP-dependent RNA helicase DHX33